MNSPLEGIGTVSDLLSLSYFEFLACMGEISLHPGAERSTQELINAAEIRIGDRVLEVGCGTGMTTRRLINAGAVVTVVEQSPRMLAATLQNCQRVGVAEPNYLLTSAEDLSGLPVGCVDVTLFECVLGFLKNKPLAISESERVMAGPRATIGVIDLHYVTTPPAHLVNELERAVSKTIEPLTEMDWKCLFSKFELVYWSSNALPHVAAPGVAIVEDIVKTSELPNKFPDLSIDDYLALSEKWSQWESVFARNRGLLRYHVAVWRVGG